MPNQKRSRKREGREARLAAIAAAQKKAKLRRQVIAAVLVGALVLSVAALLNGGGSGDKKVTAAASTTIAPVVSTTVASGPTTTTSVVVGAAACPPAGGSATRSTTFAAEPAMCIDPAKSYSAEVKTTKGTFTIELDAKGAPRTVNNFVFLARNRYYDGVTFHRVIPDFVIQGGDPDGTGKGGPGYKFADELPPPNQYKTGSLAMANAGPNTNGSQFFVVVSEGGAQQLGPAQPKYNLFGHVTSGMDVVKAIEALGSASGTPIEVVTMQTVTIKES